MLSIPCLRKEHLHVVKPLGQNGLTTSQSFLCPLNLLSTQEKSTSKKEKQTKECQLKETAHLLQNKQAYVHETANNIRAKDGTANA
jgi:hypothetical protein